MKHKTFYPHTRLDAQDLNDLNHNQVQHEKHTAAMFSPGILHGLAPTVQNNSITISPGAFIAEHTHNNTTTKNIFYVDTTLTISPLPTQDHDITIYVTTTTSDPITDATSTTHNRTTTTTFTTTAPPSPTYTILIGSYSATSKTISRTTTSQAFPLWYPIGTILPFTQHFLDNTTIKGWYRCEGQTINGTTLPDLRDRFLKGKTDSETLGTISGANSLTLTTNQLPPHTHDATGLLAACHSAGRHQHQEGIWFWSSFGLSPYQYFFNNKDRYFLEPKHIYGDASHYRPLTEYGGDHSHAITLSGTTATTGSSAPIDNRPASYSIIYITKVH